MKPKCFQIKKRGPGAWKKMKRRREEDEEKSKSEQCRMSKKAKKSEENFEEKFEENKKMREGIRKESKKQEQKGRILRKRTRSPERSAGEGSSRKKRPCVPATRPASFNINCFRFHSELGRGAFAKVMMATWTSRKQRVAMKVSEKTPETEMEVRVLQVAKGSPFLCHAYGAFQSENHAYIVLEYIRGGTLMAAMRKAGFLKEDTIAFYAAEMICGLQFLHSNGIIHRDLKPANILLDGERHIKIADFGLAMDNMVGNNTTTGLIGTTRYMAPEVLQGEQYNAAADWWSLGIIIYQMATSIFPFFATNGNQLTALMEEPIYPSWLSKELVDLLQALLKKDHHLRLGTTGNIRKHPFFHHIDWVQLENRQVQPPFQLAVRSVEDFCDSDGESAFFSSKKMMNSNSRVLEDFSFLDSGCQE